MLRGGGGSPPDHVRDRLQPSLWFLRLSKGRERAFAFSWEVSARRSDVLRNGSTFRQAQGPELFLPFVIILDHDLVSVPIRETGRHSPASIDRHGPSPPHCASQGMKPRRLEGTQRLERGRHIKCIEPHHRPLIIQTANPTPSPILEKPTGVTVSEWADHYIGCRTSYIIRQTYSQLPLRHSRDNVEVRMIVMSGEGGM